MKKYKAIFFDWDGTAVTSRTADPSDVLNAMKPLLLQGVQLIVISGTTMKNICGGKLEDLLPAAALKNMSLGLARGNLDLGFDKSGKLSVLFDATPSIDGLVRLHKVCFELHCHLLEKYGVRTDIFFSRDNYCKIDLAVDLQRTETLFLQHGDLERVEKVLSSHGYTHGLTGLISLAADMGKANGLALRATTDAKYLEVGYTTKSDSIDRFLQRLAAQGINTDECCYWGDEFGSYAPGLWGSDAQMLTPNSLIGGDFFSVSTLDMPLPKEVQNIGGSCGSFLNFLHEQVNNKHE